VNCNNAHRLYSTLGSAHIVQFTSSMPYLDSTSSLEPLLRRLPVDHIPDGREVLGFPVLVLQIVCVLPGVDSEQRPELAYHSVLVGICLDTNSAGLRVLHQPCPSRALNTRQCSIELLLHAIEAAIGGIDGISELARWWLTTARGLWCEILPEEGVVGMSACNRVVNIVLSRSYVPLRTSVKVDQRLLSQLSLDITLCLDLLHLLLCCIVGVHVCSVMLVVVQLHDLA
jgi:hypothetical protein